MKLVIGLLITVFLYGNDYKKTQKNLQSVASQNLWLQNAAISFQAHSPGVGTRHVVCRNQLLLFVLLLVHDLFPGPIDVQNNTTYKIVWLNQSQSQ
jgi:hypothetical protein